MNPILLVCTLALLAAGACRIPVSTESKEPPAGGRYTATSSRTRVAFRDRPVSAMIEEIERHRVALEPLAPATDGLVASLTALIDRLDDLFSDARSTPYVALTPEQQAVYNEVAILIEELRLLLGRTYAGPPPPPAPAARRV